MAAVLAAILENSEAAAKYNFLTQGAQPHAPFEFCIIGSGFIPRDKRLAQALFKAPDDDEIPTQYAQQSLGLHTRSLHIIGLNDAIVIPERSQALVKVSTNSRVEEHDGGHFVPLTTPWRNFLRSYLVARSDEEGLSVISPQQNHPNVDLASASSAL